jgi:hypothetical protein
VAFTPEEEKVLRVMIEREAAADKAAIALADAEAALEAAQAARQTAVTDVELATQATIYDLNRQHAPAINAAFAAVAEAKQAVSAAQAPVKAAEVKP